MADVISNTSPLQYLHQIRQLSLLERLCGRIIVPSAVVEELAVGTAVVSETIAAELAPSGGTVPSEFSFKTQTSVEPAPKEPVPPETT